MLNFERQLLAPLAAFMNSMHSNEVWRTKTFPRNDSSEITKFAKVNVKIAKG